MWRRNRVDKDIYTLLKQDEPYTAFPWFVGVMKTDKGKVVHRIHNGPFASESVARAVLREAEAK
jgi:hypothetical protein